jgi:hypothetical protein
MGSFSFSWSWGKDKKNKKKAGGKAALLSLDRRKKIFNVFKKDAQSGNLPVQFDEENLSGFMKTAPVKINGEDVNGEIHFKIDPYGDLELAAVIPTKMSDPHSYLNKLIDYDKLTTKDREQIVKLCRTIAKFEGVVNTSLDVLTGIIPMSGWNVTNVKNKDAKRLCEIWCEKVNGFPSEAGAVENAGGIENWIQNSDRVMLRDGDYVGLKKWDNVEIPELSKKFNLPVTIENMDVLKLEWPTDLQKVKKKVFYVELPDRLVKIAKDGIGSGRDKKEEQIDKIIDESLSDELKTQINEFSGKPPLPGEFVIHLSRKSDGGGWGEPFIEKCFGALAYKNRIRQLDNSTIAGLIQRMWIVKIGLQGSEDHEFPDPDRMNMAISTFNKLKVQNFIIWPGPDIETEELSTSDSSILSFESRYTEADDDIYRALGVPRLFVEGRSSGSSERDSETFMALNSILKNKMIQYQRIINKVLREIMEENGFKDEYPEFSFMQLSIADIKGFRNITLQKYEKGLIGRRKALRDMGDNPDRTIDEQIQEKKEKLNEQIPEPPLPYQGQGKPLGTGDGEGEGTGNKPPRGTQNRKNQQNS